MDSSEEGKSNRSVEVLSINLTELKGALLSSIERIEGILSEAESTASHEAQQYEALRQMSEAKLAMLEAKLREEEEGIRSRESAIKQLEENLNSKIQELEHQLTEKEDFARLLEEHNSETTILKSEAEAKLGILEAKLQDREESLRKTESSISQLEERLTAEIQDLEDQLGEKASLLDVRQTDLNNVSPKLDDLGDSSEGIVTLREEDVVTPGLPNQEGEKGIYWPEVQGKLTENLKDMVIEAERLRAQIQERDAMLAAKEEEVSRQLIEKEESLRARVSAAKQQEDILTARIHDLEDQLSEKETVLLEEEKSKGLLDSTSAELERLKADLRDRNLLLEARETEVRMIKQSVQEKFRGLERIVNRPEEGEARKSRLVSLLATIEKKH